MNNILERIEIAESLGYISYGNRSDTPEQKAIAKWWNAENPSALVELPTLNELTIEMLERELAEARKQRNTLAEALKSLCKAIISGEPLDITDLLKQSGAALAATKGGQHE
jgi:hypothetical protein